MISRVTLIPDLNLGIVVLTNQLTGSGVTNSVTWTIADHYLGAPRTDYVALYAKARDEQEKKYAEEQQKHEAARAKDSTPSLPLERYAGRYTDPWYGDVNIAQENGKLVMRFSHTPELTADLEHWQHDTFIARWRARFLDADAFVTFSLDPDGDITTIAMKPLSTRTDFSFDFQDLALKRAK
jgi:hypothetical protein